jgi:hypothetical protein
MAFPLDVRADMATCDVQFGSVRRPTHPTTTWDAAKFEVCAHRYVDIAEPGFGVAILNNGRYGHGVFDGQVRVSLLRAARYPDPDADQGLQAVDLAVYPHGSGLADVVREAERLNTPVRAVRGSAAAVAPPVVSLTGTGVELDAVKMADDGNGDLVVRLHEACGDRRHVMVRQRRIPPEPLQPHGAAQWSGWATDRRAHAAPVRAGDAGTTRWTDAQHFYGQLIRATSKGQCHRRGAMPSVIAASSNMTRFQMVGERSPVEVGRRPPRNIIEPGTRCSTRS